MDAELRELEERVTRIERHLAMMIGSGTSAPQQRAAQHGPIHPQAATPPTTPVVQSATRRRPDAAPGLSEETVIGTWFPRVGGLALVLGAAFGFNLAVDRGWIGPPIRILLGCLVGLSLMFGGEVTRRMGWRAFGQAVTGGGIAMLYLTTWASWHLFGYLSAEVACLLLVGLSAVGVATSLRHDGQPLAVMAVLGAFWSPFATGLWVASVPSSYSYVLCIDLGVIAVSCLRPWRILMRVALTSTWIVFGVIHSNDATAFAAATGAFALFLSAPWIRSIIRNESQTARDIAPFVANSLIFYAFVSVRLDADDGLSSAAFTLVLAALHGAAGAVMLRRPPTASLGIVSSALGIFFVTLWVPLEFEAEAVPFLWALEAALLFAAGALSRGLLGAAWLVLVLSIVVHFGPALEHPFALTDAASRITFGVQIVILFAASLLSFEDDPLRHLNNVAGVVGAHVLSLAWLSIETSAFVVDEWRDEMTLQFAITAIWALYASALLVAGVGIRSSTCRILSVGIFGLTLAKMTTTDLWLLPELQRLIGFGGIGTLLIICSMTFHRFKSFFSEEENPAQAKPLDPTDA